MMPKTQHPADSSLDPIIDCTLASIRDAQPRAGVDALNRRLLAGLQQHQAQRQTATPTLFRRRSSILHWRFPELVLPAVAMILVAATLLIPHLQPRNIAKDQPPSSPATSHLAKLTPTTQATTLPTTQATTLPTTQATMRVPHISILRCGPATTLPCTTAATHLTETHVSSITPAEQALLDDLHAPSQPAPPMPLTRDERQLIRAARRSEQVQLAQLEALPRPAPRNSSRQSIAEYVHRMLAPLVAAESIEPTPADDPTPPPSEQPPPPLNY